MFKKKLRRPDHLSGNMELSIKGKGAKSVGDVIFVLGATRELMSVQQLQTSVITSKMTMD